MYLERWDPLYDDCNVRDKHLRREQLMYMVLARTMRCGGERESRHGYQRVGKVQGPFRLEALQAGRRCPASLSLRPGGTCHLFIHAAFTPASLPNLHNTPLHIIIIPYIHHLCSRAVDPRRQVEENVLLQQEEACCTTQQPASAISAHGTTSSFSAAAAANCYPEQL